jgi:hypothetical protein
VAELAAVLRALALLTLLLTSGWAVARLTDRRADLFAITWWGLALVSIAGVLLARTGRFSLVTLGVACAAATLVALAVGVGRRSHAAGTGSGAPASGAVRWVACAAGILACGATWPPFETFMAAADSTMYVNAGVHLARTGSYDVPDTVVRLLRPDLARGLFPSVDLLGRGPFIRLSGGLLMPNLDATSSTPAFFPLLPVWTGALAAVGGPGLASAAAPLGIGLAVWAVTLFAGETLGLAAAVTTALVFAGNFAVWWFGRFPMSESLTIAFVWGGLVFLGRRAPFAAGVMLGLGGVARAETLLFTAVAVAGWAAWTSVRSRDLALLAAGFACSGLLVVGGLLMAPSHHFAYLWNGVTFTWVRMATRMLPAFWDGRILAAAVLVPMLPLLAGVAATWYGGSLARNTLRAAISFAIVAGVGFYLRFGDRSDPLRHLGWLATSMSPLGLGLGVVGGGLVWWRGGPVARLSVALVVLVGTVFVPKPQISAYQPWAMRRFLPIVLPGLAIGVGALLGRLMESSRLVIRATAVALLVAVVTLQLRPTWAARDRPYFADSLEHVRRVADLIPANALVAIDSGFADLQLQVPLWLVFGRETVVVTGGRPIWQELLTTLTVAGRPVYWIQNRLAPPPKSPGLVFTAAPGESDFAIALPDAPADVPPALTIRKLVPLAIYGVTTGSGEGDG